MPVPDVVAPTLRRLSSHTRSLVVRETLGIVRTGSNVQIQADTYVPCFPAWHRQ